jgi:glycosyltransferase involved in cell wall biosynthesis
MNTLFITWDGPQTNYLEGLFTPIFEGLQRELDLQFYVVQFTWASLEQTEKLKKSLLQKGIVYTAFPIRRKPQVHIGTLITLYKGIRFLNKYIKENEIDNLMPRSIFPAIMVNRLSNQNIKIIYDADGLNIEERVDFGGLKRGSWLYKLLNKEEAKIINKSQKVLTRSQKAIDYYLSNIQDVLPEKFSVVSNGRDIQQFTILPKKRALIRKEMGINENTIVFVYAGSFGPQYGWEAMFEIFTLYHQVQPNSHFLFLTGTPEQVLSKIPKNLQSKFTVKRVPTNEVPYYLNASDVAMAIRKPTLSMQGVAPIKLGEYLLTGLPVIASQGIGDTEQLLQHILHCFLFDHEGINGLEEVVQFINKLKNINRNLIREHAMDIFSKEASIDSYKNIFL